MGSFFDDFERANGAPGGNWVAAQGTPAITGGTLGYSGHWIAYNSAVSDGGYQESVAHVYFTPNTTNFSGPAVKCAAASSLCYLARVSSTGGVATFYITSRNNTVLTTLTSVVLSGTVPPYLKLAIKWDHGHITAVYQDSVTLECDDSVLAGQAYPGLSGVSTSTGADDVRLVGSLAVGFTVAPGILGNYGACVPITLTGTSTAWTPGTPGSPVFRVDHGTISTQTVLTATTATATYCPGTYLGPATFTDPSTGATAIATVTSDPAIVPPGGIALSADAIAYIERSAAAETNATIVNRNEQVNFYAGTRTVSETIETIQSTLADPAYASGGQAGILPLLIQVFDLLNGGADWGGTATVFGNTSIIKSGVDSLATALSDLQGPGGVSLAVLAAALSDLRGTGSPSLADVLAAASGGDSSTVLAAIAAVRGAGSPDLRTLADLAEGMRTIHGYDLASVKGWIDALPQTQSGPTALLILATVAALALAIPSGGASIAAEAVAIGAGPLLDLTTLVEVASIIGTLAGLASDVATIKGSLSPTAALTAPIWPGLDHATVGASVALADGLQVAGPLDGLLVSITGTPSKAGRYAFGDLSSWKYVGAVVFKSDRGDWEWNHPIGLDSQIVTPKAMAHAAAARFRLEGGFSGTVRPFNVNA